MNNHEATGEIEKRLKSATKQLNEMSPLVGAAKQVIEFSSDQRKMALAVSMKPYIERGESAAAAETLGRAHPLYIEKMKKLEQSFAEAQRMIYEWQATFASFDAARSLLAMERETRRALEP